MRFFKKQKNAIRNQKADEKKHLPFSSSQLKKRKIIFSILFVLSTLGFTISLVSELIDDKKLKQQQIALQKNMEEAIERTEKFDFAGGSVTIAEKEPMGESKATEETELSLDMLPEYEALYRENDDFIGWLRIEDTVIDYPVMQCKEDENYYLSYDFYKKENKNGCLILDNDSQVGRGNKLVNYENGENPSTNLIIHGHMTKTGQMFGKLILYKDKEYGLAHNIISFDSLYEKRKYELITVFYSKVFYENEDVFKYYNFFQADTQEEFDDWYQNIKKKALYDTGVKAKFGDEFITLSVCSYHIQDGRFVVVGKRIYD
ncbi:MAG: class B sortase [Lachnospiraceae bacterium]|nr:class B sortase [Lachnospiraceae bacterium]